MGLWSMSCMDAIRLWSWEAGYIQSSEPYEIHKKHSILLRCLTITHALTAKWPLKHVLKSMQDVSKPKTCHEHAADYCVRSSNILLSHTWLWLKIFCHSFQCFEFLSVIETASKSLPWRIRNGSDETLEHLLSALTPRKWHSKVGT